MADQPDSIAVFFGLDDGPLEPLHESDAMQKVRGSLANAPAVVRNFATESVRDALKSALNVPLVDVFAAALKTFQDLRKYCDQSKYPPGEISNYALARHVISSSHRPRFRVLFEGTPCGPEIDFDVELKLTIEAASLEILDAKIMKVATGSIQGSGSISCAGATLIERKTSPLAIPGKFSFGDGILIGMPHRGEAPSVSVT